MSTINYRGEEGFDPFRGRGGVNGVGGNIGGLSGNTTGAPVGYIPSNQVQTSMIPGDPMSQIGNAGYFNNTEVAGGPALPGEPGKNPIPTAPGGRPHLPGEKQTPLPGRFQARGSSNLPTAMPQSGTAFQVGNMNPLIAQAPAGQQTQTSNLLNPLDWFSGRNQQVLDEVEKGTYKGGKGGPVDSMLQKNNRLNDLINNM